MPKRGEGWRGRERERERGGGVDRGGRWMLYHRSVILRRGGAAAVGEEKRNTEREWGERT